VVANVDARVHRAPGEWPGLLSAQLCSPVRWRQTLETLAALGASTLVELGPGGVLSGLVRRSAPELTAVAVSKPDDLDKLMEIVANPDAGRAEPAVPEGEHLYVSERVVVSPAAGIFSPEASVAAPGTGLLPGTDRAGSGETSTVGVGDLLGRVGSGEVRTPFAGRVVRWLVGPGERVQEGQPVAWLHAEGDAG